MYSDENTIEFTDVSKSFRIYMDRGFTLKEKALFRKRNAYTVRRVLSHVSFSVKRGEAVGLIGHNGCGKSTTLKLLTQIIYPDTGKIRVRGRISSLIELGAGFHPDMSGRDNIYMNASIFGLSKKETDEKMDDIISFSELGPYIDNPIRTYSSGMYMRLAFSVAINVDADVLLIDEILAVGDANFQKKCFEKLREIKQKGTTIVIVSHSLPQIEQICDRSIWINQGHIEMDDNPYRVHSRYMNFMETYHFQDSLVYDDGKEEVKENRKKTAQEQPIRFRELVITDGKGNGIREACTGDHVKIRVSYQVRIPTIVWFKLSFMGKDGNCCYGTKMTIRDIKEFTLRVDGEVTVEFPSLQLAAGEYRVKAEVIRVIDGYLIDTNEDTVLEVGPETEEFGCFHMEHGWEKDVIEV